MDSQVTSCMKMSGESNGTCAAVKLLQTTAMSAGRIVKMTRGSSTSALLRAQLAQMPRTKAETLFANKSYQAVYVGSLMETTKPKTRLTRMNRESECTSRIPFKWIESNIGSSSHQCKQRSRVKIGSSVLPKNAIPLTGHSWRLHDSFFVQPRYLAPLSHGLMI